MKDIPGFPGYIASEDGRIYSTRTKVLTEIKPRMHKGYLHVFVKLGQGRLTKVKRGVHQLVTLAYHGQKPTPAHEVRHLDGSRTNNKPGNLCWGTRAQNVSDAIRHGTAVQVRRGTEHPRGRLSTADVAEIRRRAVSGEAYRRIAERYHVDPAYISRIARGLDRPAA